MDRPGRDGEGEESSIVSTLLNASSFVQSRTQSASNDNNGVKPPRLLCLVERKAGVPRKLPLRFRRVKEQMMHLIKTRQMPRNHLPYSRLKGAQAAIGTHPGDDARTDR